MTTAIFHQKLQELVREHYESCKIEVASMEVVCHDWIGTVLVDCAVDCVCVASDLCDWYDVPGYVQTLISPIHGCITISTIFDAAVVRQFIEDSCDIRALN